MVGRICRIGVLLALFLLAACNSGGSTEESPVPGDGTTSGGCGGNWNELRWNEANWC